VEPEPEPRVTETTEPPGIGEVEPAERRQRQRYLTLAMVLVAIVAAVVMSWALRSYRQAVVGPKMPTPIVLDEIAEASPFKGFVIRPERPAPDFTLTDQTGEAFQMSGLRGQAVLLFFGFTHCPDVCPNTLVKLAAAVEELDGAAEDVEIVFVTVDPERDTQEALARYVDAFEFKSRVHAVRGEEEALKAVARSYGVDFFREVPEGADPETEYTMAHTATVFLIDPQGQLRASFLGPYTPEEVAHDVRVLLEEQADGLGASSG
jgi:protein SCO1/2